MTYILIIIVGYFALLAALSVAARPYRKRLSLVAHELCADYPGDDYVDAVVTAYLASAYSWRSAPIRLLGLLLGIVTPASALDQMCDRAEKEHPRLLNDPRLFEIVECHFASIAAVNPIIGALAYGARYAFILKARMHYSALKTKEIVGVSDMKAMAA